MIILRRRKMSVGRNESIIWLAAFTWLCLSVIRYIADPLISCIRRFTTQSPLIGRYPKAGLDHARRQWIRCNLDGPSEMVTRNSMWNKLYFMQTNIYAFIEFHHNWNRPCNKQIKIQSPANICNSLKMKWHQPGWNTWTLKGICSKQSWNFFFWYLIVDW